MSGEHEINLPEVAEERLDEVPRATFELTLDTRLPEKERLLESRGAERYLCVGQFSDAETTSEARKALTTLMSESPDARTETTEERDRSWSLVSPESDKPTAEARAKEAREKGFQARVIEGSWRGTWHALVGEKTDSAEAAEAAKKSARKNGLAWIIARKEAVTSRVTLRAGPLTKEPPETAVKMLEKWAERYGATLYSCA